MSKRFLLKNVLGWKIVLPITITRVSIVTSSLLLLVSVPWRMEEEWELRMASEENRDCVCVCSFCECVITAFGCHSSGNAWIDSNDLTSLLVLCECFLFHSHSLFTHSSWGFSDASSIRWPFIKCFHSKNFNINPQIDRKTDDAVYLNWTLRSNLSC